MAALILILLIALLRTESYNVECYEKVIMGRSLPIWRYYSRIRLKMLRKATKIQVGIAGITA